MNLTFYARDASNQPLGQLDAFTKLEFVPAYDAIRGWYVEMDADTDQVEMMQSARWLAIYCGSDPIYTGSVNRMGYRKADNTAVFRGWDALRLAKRRALPVPSGPPYTSAEYDVRTGAAETVIKAYVDYNAGPSAKADRQIPGLTIEPDYGRGDQHTGRARFDNLTEFICAIGLARGLGLRVLDGQFQIWQPADKTASILFSDVIDTLGDYEFEVGDPEANYLYGAGSGSGVTQAFYERGDAASIAEYGRLEHYLNIGRTAVDAEISAQIDSDLQKLAAAAWFKFDIVETPDRAFWTDLWLGDLVTVQARGLSFTTRMSELTITAYPDGTQTLQPVFINNATFELTRREYDRLRQMEQRIARLEER